MKELFKKFEHYFIDNTYGASHVFKIGDLNDVIWNLNIALAHLGYNAQRGQCDYSKRTYEGMQDFQVQNQHNNIDGSFGPGTRKLLVEKIIAKKGEHFFQEYLIEIRLKKQYLRDLITKNAWNELFFILKDSMQDFIRKDEIISLEAQFNDITRQYNNSNIKYEDYNSSINKTRNGIITLVEDLPNVNKCHPIN